MTTLYNLTPSMAIISFIFATTLLLVSIYCMITAGTTETKSEILLTMIPLIVDLILFHAVFDCCSAISGHGEIRSYAGRLFAEIPNGLRIAAILIMTYSTGARIRSIKRTTNSVLTPFSVGEALDTMPMGVAFVGETGIMLQSNEKMDDLSYRLTGGLLSNGNKFWDKISAGEIPEDYEFTPGEFPIVTAPDGTAWMFKKLLLETEIGNINQILAIDTTNEQNMIKELEAGNEKLELMNRRLRSYSDMVDETIRREELLQAKMRVHDQMGEALLSAKILIQNEKSPVSEKTVLDRWKLDMSLLREEAREEETKDQGYEQIQRLLKAASHLGIDLQLVGTMPEDFDTMQLICIGIQECMTNALQHAEATQMYVAIKEEPYEYIVSYSNNGKPLEGPIKEGGGLSLLRESAEKLNAEIEYVDGARFNMLLRIPKGQEAKYV